MKKGKKFIKFLKWTGIVIFVSATTFFITSLVLANQHGVTMLAEWQSWGDSIANAIQSAPISNLIK